MLQKLKQNEEPMNWRSNMESLLAKPIRNSSATSPVCIDLFSGCGGLGLGFEAAGFKTIGFEKDSDAAASYRLNLGDCITEDLNIETNFPNANLLVGGPPCQPFSVGGKQAGPRDARDGFPTFLSAIERVQPAIAIFENVRGLFYKNKAYLHLILRELEKLNYLVDAKLLDASHFSVPQRRQRLFVVATRVGWIWPRQNFIGQSVVSDAIGDTMELHQDEATYLTPAMDKYISEYEQKSHCINPRDLRPTQVARTLTCRNLGGLTSDMMRVRLSSGKRRTLTVREAARLQTFPDWFQFQGSKYKKFEQIGNAVPPLLSLQIANAARQQIDFPSSSIEDTNAPQPRLI